jgi:hypothetical protein
MDASFETVLSNVVYLDETYYAVNSDDAILN